MAAGTVISDTLQVPLFVLCGSAVSNSQNLNGQLGEILKNKNIHRRLQFQPLRCRPAGTHTLEHFLKKKVVERNWRGNLLPERKLNLFKK
jgi:hypothetical protein